MLLPGNRIGGTNSYKLGDLKRRLDPVIVAIADGALTPDVTVTNIFRRIVLKGLSGDLNVQIAAGPVTPTDNNPVEAAPGNPATDIAIFPNGIANMQLTPVVWSGNQAKMFLRPVFQDPFAAVGNTNNPLAQDLPFGWEFSTEADEVYIDINLRPLAFPGSITLNVIVSVTIEYNGQWWDTKAIQAALGQVQLTGGGSPTRFGTLAT